MNSEREVTVKDWYVLVGFTVEKPFDEDSAFDFTGRLGGAPMSVERDMTGGEIGLFVTTETIFEAQDKGLDRIRSAADGTIGPLDINRIEVTTEEDFDRELATPLFPDVVGFAEIARMADVTRQAARDYAKGKMFPVPVIVTAQGPLFAKAAVEAWLEKKSARSNRKALITA